MPRHAKPLSEMSIRKAKPDDFPLWDGDGLHLIERNGRRHWRLKYTRPDGRENRMAFGAYPAITLKDARAMRDDARRNLVAGIDPCEARKERRREAEHATRDTFERFAREWLAVKSRGWAIETRRKMELCVNAYLVPAIGNRNVRTITSADTVKLLQIMIERTPSLTRKAAQAAQAIIRTAITAGAREEGRILDLNLRDNLPAFAKRHFPAATLPSEMGNVLRTIAGYSSEVTRAALLTCAYTAQRPGDVVAMRWQDISGDIWHIPKTKTGHAHLVPLPRQVIRLLEDMKRFTAGREYVFPPLARQSTPHLHRDALSKALRDSGLRGKQTPHGLRASLRTMARERLGVSADVLEAQLAHAKRGEVQAAYDRTSFNDERRKMIQVWSDYLDELREGGSVVPLKRKPV